VRAAAATEVVRQRAAVIAKRASMITSQSLPVTQSDAPAAACASLFSDVNGALRWLASQPQANAAAMLDALVGQIEAFDARDLAPGERYAVLEALRATVVAVAVENRKRYEFRALPLLPDEYATFTAVARLWRACARAYQHCLQADVTGVTPAAARAAQCAQSAQRALACLRMEQFSAYVAGCELAPDFWSRLHAAWVCAERLGCARQMVVDPALKETLESTPSGHYAMAVLLHLARPYALSRAELTAACRWFVRWRELCRVGEAPSTDASAFALGEDAPWVEAVSRAGAPSSAPPMRWFSARGVLRKLRERAELLAAGQSPESLKLGSGMSARACMSLLRTLDYRLSHPLPPFAASDAAPGDGVPVIVAVGLAACHRQLGGARPDRRTTQTSSFDSQLVAQQIAVFGHAVREPDRSSERAGELWGLVVQDAGHSQLRLVRPPGGGDARVALRSLLMLRLPQRDDDLLAVVSSLCLARDGSVHIDARRLGGQPTALFAEVRDRHTAKGERHAAIILSAASGIGAPQLFIAPGLSSRQTPIRFLDIDGEPIAGLCLDECLDRSADCERWSVAV
jgi:hypothetical protein